MKHTEENEHTTSFQQPWVFVLCAPLFKSHFLRFMTYCLATTAVSFSTHKKSKEVGRNKTSYGLKCKTAFGKVLKPTIYIYTDHTFFSSDFLSFDHNFPFVHPSVFHFTLKKETKLSLFTQLLSYCKNDVSSINSSTVQS